MMHRSDDDVLGDRVAEPLRELERADSTFEARVMSAVHAAARAAAEEPGAGPGSGRRSWWLRPREVRLTPLVALALAAGVVAILVGSSIIAGNRRHAAIGTATAVDTVHVVRFVLVDSAARRVALVGAFNQWRKGATLLQETETPGVWTIDMPLPNGRYEYAFVVSDRSGERWVADPYAVPVHDEFGTETSVVTVGDATS